MGDSVDAIGKAIAFNRIEGHIVDMHGVFVRA
jgi:hypothetical protein